MSLLDGVPDVPPCDSQIWGSGKLIDTIQRAKLFDDSKTFVDLKLLHPAETVIKNFEALPESPSKDTLKKFVLDNFSMDNNLEFEDWDPEDWDAKPDYLEDLSQKPLVYVGMEVNKLWKILSQRCSSDLKNNPGLYSKIYLPHGFIMPGGRFREIYYWDTYWIVRGMLVSKMTRTVKGVLENFIYQINQFGHIPNGTRVYYLRRTQPPFLPSMVSKYLEVTQDLEFLKDNIGALEKELKFFEDHRSLVYTKDDKSFTVFRFGADCRGPRPESYIEDVEIAEKLFDTEERREEFYLHMKAAAESGWDFSSRWFIDEKGGNTGTLANANTCHIIPVDLNALMYKNYVHLAEFFSQLGDEKKVEEYTLKSNDMMKTMAELLWDSEENMWFDWDMLNHKRRSYFYASNLFPLWAEAYPKKLRNTIGKCAVSYLLRTGATRHKGGVPASLQHSGQQWDWNAWPPLQHLIVSGLNKTKNAEAQKLAFRVARNYALATMKSCNKDEEGCELFEKYDPTSPGLAGGGGEYEVQLGFGWTNGVLIDFITTYGDDLLELEEYKPRDVIELYGSKGKERYTKILASKNGVNVGLV